MFARRIAWIGLLAALAGAGEAQAIINGTLDTSYECVGSLHELGSGTMVGTGTLIHESWVLTAASIAAGGVDVFAMGPDWADGPRLYLVDLIVVHPSYDGNGIFDFALLHLAEPAVGEPVCAPLTAPEDTIIVGSVVTHVGYGITSYPSGFTTQRHRTINTVADLDSIGFFTSYEGSGPCSGDFGGPALRAADSRLAGVISVTDGSCSVWAYDGKVSLITEPWIVPTILSFSGIFFDGFELGTTERWSAVGP